MEFFEVHNGAAEEAVPFASHLFQGNECFRLIAQAQGWVGGAQRLVEVYDTGYGILLKVDGSVGFLIAAHGKNISTYNQQEELSQLDRDVLLGPLLVWALALRGTWSLHASAVMYKGSVIAFLGESGFGKSTLASYLSQQAGWRLVADDILPIRMDGNQVAILPHFPQLKLSLHNQPADGLPEKMPLKYICVLQQAVTDEMPELQKITAAQGIRSLLGNVAGTRMFNPDLLTKHLNFSTQAAKKIFAYRLIHPHRYDTLPLVQEFLKNLC